ncbi:MAG: ORF6N domain-containing protein [Candidatus Omnitrophica bacterium]|nr:ORF6N domain-containing protein [Candidatus Omnitrophota bacterium]
MHQRISKQDVAEKIHIVRDQRVILDADLARVYGVSTKAFNQAIKRNQQRFPADFSFRLTKPEANKIAGRSLRSQIVTSKAGRGGRRYLPYAFTGHGAVMAANILNSRQATRMSVFVVRAFVQMRSVMSEQRELAEKLVELDARLTGRLDVHESALVDILKRIMELIDPPPAPEPPPPPAKPPIGFHV